jgi:hypothetical protein
MIVAAVVLARPATSAAECVDSCFNDDLEDPSGHFRVDVDKFGLQAWALGQFPVSDDVAFAGNIYAIEGGSSALTGLPAAGLGPSWRPTSRVDAGVIFRLGVVELFPKLGFAMDFGGTNAVSLVPQLFAIVRGGPVHFETWNQLFLNAAFKNGSLDVFYTRNQLLVSPWNVIGFGFQLELTLGVHNRLGDAKMSLPIGGTIQLQPSKTDVIQVFVAGETDDGAVNGGHGITGRLTYLHTF